uniref:Uncharacterized protein n=1 Tax=Anguilla anguilla TaxID=7936 RepID=A0A0E9WXK5_ANGAN
MQGKMQSLVDDWAKLDVSLKKTYKQLAEDDRVRYAHEMGIVGEVHGTDWEGGSRSKERHAQKGRWRKRSRS